ncbi:MAG: gliding motility lipoprotein GldH [Bacteroidales bacterium]|nr:gliding motility lipoprotein GldH [Bacteroidales bacterium]MBR2887908.1 gliding motility lipoprotein GldH [Bacteroidales bacterium]
MKIKLLFVGLLALVLASCNPNRVFVERVTIPDMVWHMDSLVNITVPVDDSAQFYDIKIAIRSNVYFQSRNLWLFINTYSPENVVEVDTLECILADEQGHTTGDPALDIIDYEIPFKTGVRFPTTGNYRFAIQHGMRMEKLPCIDEIGIIMDKHPKSDK